MDSDDEEGIVIAEADYFNDFEQSLDAFINILIAHRDSLPDEQRAAARVKIWTSGEYSTACFELL